MNYGHTRTEATRTGAWRGRVSRGLFGWRARCKIRLNRAAFEINSTCPLAESLRSPIDHWQTRIIDSRISADAIIAWSKLSRAKDRRITLGRYIYHGN